MVVMIYPEHKSLSLRCSTIPSRMTLREQPFKTGGKILVQASKAYRYSECSRILSNPQLTMLSRYGAPSLSEPGSLRVQSAWLQQFGVPLEVLELRAPATEGKAVKTLLSADVPIIVCNSATTPLPSLLTRLAPVLAHPNAVLVLTSSSGSEALINRIRSLCEHDLTILFIDPSRALKALRILSSAPSSSTAVEKYQENFTASNLSKLTEAVSHAIVDAARGTSSFAVVQNLHAQTAHSIVQNSLSACQSVLQTARHEVDELCTQVSALRARAEEVRVKAAREVFGPADGSKSNAIQTSLDKSRRDIKPTMDSWTWWKLLLRPDDVGDTVLTIVDQVWCKDLEHRVSLFISYRDDRLTSVYSSSSTQVDLLRHRVRSQSLARRCSPPFLRVRPSTRPSCKTVSFNSLQRLRSLWMPLRLLYRSLHAGSNSGFPLLDCSRPRKELCSPCGGAYPVVWVSRGQGGQGS